MFSMYCFKKYFTNRAIHKPVLIYESTCNSYSKDYYFQFITTTALSISSSQCRYPSPAQSRFTPESSRSLLLRSSSLRGQFTDCRTEAKDEQDSPVSLQRASLGTERGRDRERILIFMHWRITTSMTFFVK